jgi:hypothetical protein
MLAGKAISALIFLILSGLAFAGDEQLGPTHPVAEPDLLEEIYSGLRKKESSGELARLQKEAIERSRRHAVEPNPVAGLRRTNTPRKFYWDPTFVADGMCGTTKARSS